MTYNKFKPIEDYVKIVNPNKMDKFGNVLKTGDAVLLQQRVGKVGCIVKEDKLYHPAHYITYEQIQKGRYLPKPITEIESEYLEIVDKSIFDGFPYYEEL